MLHFTAKGSEAWLHLMTMSLWVGREDSTEATVTNGAQLTSTQKGRVTEQMVASALLIASEGRLAPFVRASLGS